jgi:16S rRNA processing protein RimM
VKTQGRHGEVAAELHTDFPERFQKGSCFCALARDAKQREVKLESSWPHKGQIVLKFAGIESISDAEALVGCELQIAASERAQLEAGSAYVSDLVGCVVFDGGREIGTVKDVQFGAGEAPLLVVKGIKDYDIPFAEAFLRDVDVARKQIHMLLPEGMLEVNDPMTPAEKVQQKKTGD